MSAPDPVVLGPVAADEFVAFYEAFNRTFGQPTREDALERVGATIEHDRLVAARHEGAIVGTAGAYSFELSLPGAATAGCAGVTLVSVRADHRRRGVLRRMMDHIIDEAAVRGEPFAALWASESPIYGRFGFGPAAPTLQVTVPRAHAALRLRGPVQEVELVDVDRALERIPAIYDAVRERRHGMLSRSPAWWRRELADPPARGDRGGLKRVAVLADRGYAVSQLRPSWTDGVPDGTVEVQDLAATDPEATAALWAFVLDTDLAAHTRAGRRPADEPLLALLHDPVRARPEIDWSLQLRLVDVPGALEARGYAGGGDTLVLRVHDPVRSANDGTWRLDVRDGRASCEPADGAPDLELDAEALATVSLGGVRPATLAEAGRLHVRRPDAVGRLGRLLATEVAPWHGGMF